jgi:hypothetical protein
MRRALQTLVVVAYFSCSAALAKEPFTGKWFIDLRNPAEQREKLECGSAEFKLTQTQDRVSGSHSMATVGCGRLNESGSVKGVVVGGTAVLVVTSGRNGAVVIGKANLVQGKLAWQTVEEIRSGEPAEDSGLILGRGLLTQVKE